MTTINEIVTNGNQFNLFYANGNKSGYLTFEKSIEIIEMALFTKHTINVLPNTLVMPFEKGLKLARKIQNKFEKLGYLVSFHIEDENSEAKFEVFGKSKIEITKPSQL